MFFKFFCSVRVTIREESVFVNSFRTNGMIRFLGVFLIVSRVVKSIQMRRTVSTGIRLQRQ